jgi:hypothetical protein
MCCSRSTQGLGGQECIRPLRGCVHMVSMGVAIAAAAGPLLQAEAQLQVSSDTLLGAAAVLSGPPSIHPLAVPPPASRPRGPAQPERSNAPAGAGASTAAAAAAAAAVAGVSLPGALSLPELRAVLRALGFRD